MEETSVNGLNGNNEVTFAGYSAGIHAQIIVKTNAYSCIDVYVVVQNIETFALYNVSYKQLAILLLQYVAE